MSHGNQPEGAGAYGFLPGVFGGHGAAVGGAPGAAGASRPGGRVNAVGMLAVVLRAVPHQIRQR